MPPTPLPALPPAPFLCPSGEQAVMDLIVASKLAQVSYERRKHDRSVRVVTE